MSYVANSLHSDEVVLINVPPSDEHLVQIHAIGLIVFWLFAFISGLPFVLFAGGEGGNAVTIEKALVAFIAVVTLIATAFAVYFCFVTKYFTEQAVTSHRVIYKEGLFLTKPNELRLDALEAVSVFQPFLDKILGCGKLGFTGRGGSPVTFLFVDNPVRVKKMIEQAINQQS